MCVAYVRKVRKKLRQRSDSKCEVLGHVGTMSGTALVLAVLILSQGTLIAGLSDLSSSFSEKTSLIPGGELPSFVEAISNITVPVGREAALTCRVNNLQTFKVAWLRVDTQTILTIATHVITKNHRVSVTRGDRQAWQLSIRDVQPGDGGRYMCQLNTEPMMSQTGYLQVVVPPDILDEDSSGEVSVREGAGASLHCAASGTPQPSLTWRREDSQHIRIDNHTLVSRWSGPWLNISAVERGSGGALLCIASNGVPPSVSKRFLLHVNFQPSVKTLRQLVGAPLGGGALLQCTAEASPVPQLYWTRGDGPRITNSSKYQASTSRGKYRYTLRLRILNVTRADLGLYVCHADNSLGRSDATVKLYMIVITTTTTTSTTTTTTTSPPTIPTTATHSTSIRPEKALYEFENELEVITSATLKNQEEGVAYNSKHQMRKIADFGATIKPDHWGVWSAPPDPGGGAVTCQLIPTILAVTVFLHLLRIMQISLS